MQQQHSPSGGAAVAPPRPPPGSASSPSTADGDGTASSLPFTSLPSWPQTHLLHHLQNQQAQAGVDGQLQAHVYLQHALHLAQRSMHGKPPTPAVGGGGRPGDLSALNNLKLQEYVQLQSAMAAGQGVIPSQQLKQPSTIHLSQAQAQQNQQQPSRVVPNNMAFLFGQSPQAMVAPSLQPSRSLEHNLRTPSQQPPPPQQQFMTPEALQARMLALQKAAAESSHLKLGAGISSSEAEPASSTGLSVHGNGAVAAGAVDSLVSSIRPGFPSTHGFPGGFQSPDAGGSRSMASNLPTGAKQPQFLGNSVTQSPGMQTSTTPSQPQPQGAAVQPNVLQHFSPPGNPVPINLPTDPAHAKPVGFTRQQLMVLRAQILAFRRLKRGDRSFTFDMIRAITPTPLPFVAQNQPSNPGSTAADAVQAKTSTLGSQETSNEDKLQRDQSRTHELGFSEARKEQQLARDDVVRNATVQEASRRMSEEEKKTDGSEAGMFDSPSQQLLDGPRKSQQQSSRRYRGPLFDGKAPETVALCGNAPTNAWGPPLSFGYDAAELLVQEGERIIDKKKAKKLKVIEMLLLDDIPSELKLKLRIEQRKLILLEMQGKIRNEIEEHQQEIMAMGERAYRKFVRMCERQRMELARQVMVVQKATKEKYLKGIFVWRKKLLEAHWSARDARVNRNRGVAKLHERLLREFSKRKDEDRSKRMEALKNNDVDAYREMLIKQQKEIPGDAKQRFEVLSSFLTQTEDYLSKLGGKISAVKDQQEKEEAALAAAAAARAQGLSEEEIERASSQARELVSSRPWKLDNATGSSVNKYYSLAHAVNEQIVRQPSMLRAGILRDYQLVGLQWMLSLYNNRLNGILADEMGLGKTVQVMALIAYLMEFKGNYGPHLIIVPNAVIVNWKSELLRWLPSVSCIFYVGVREERSRIYSQEVAALKFNVLVTTYEFIMRDRSKLAKIDWKYIIIDEAQRMKDRESRLARDLDRFRCQRRLLLTGTPLQNDLHELWSLLNLLLPEVFDNSKAFHDWFSKPFQKDNQTIEDDWLETEKKVIVIHRLHQILEPFMLRRRVEDVEGSLPPKVPIVLKCKMSAHQAAIYDWVKATGTIRLDPADEELRIAGGSKRQVRAYAPLQNKCMELRKVCNHPFLNYPPQGRVFHENVVRMCGKLWILDRILIKLQRAGHRVLLFSTMTKLLDILEEYLQWRGLIYRRIDGTTPLDSREAAIVDFNAPGSQCFIFLLSIRAAGRGLNLQTADTVVIYDPDPNPKNEEQAVARAHRIGQKSEVKVIYMEAVVETIPSYEKEDEIRNGGSLDVDDEMAGKDRYMGSVESLVRNNIQQHKIDMADEVINAGRFDQRTTHEERRMTLEALLHDEERYQESVHDVPTLKEVNRMISRSEEEVELFDQMDEECDWPGDMVGYDEVPEWLHVGTDEVNGAIRATSKQSLARGGSGTSGLIGTKAEEDKLLAKKNFQKRPYLSAARKKAAKRVRPAYDTVQRVARVEVEEAEELEDTSSVDDEEGEIKDGSEDDEELDTKSRKNEDQRPDSADEADEEVDAPESSDEIEEESPETQTEAEDLEEGEIVGSGDSRPDSPPSESWAQEQEEDQVTTPRKKRKRSARPRRNFVGNVPVQEAYPVGYLQPPAAWPTYGAVGHPELWRPGGFAHPTFGWNSQVAPRQAPPAEETRSVRSGARMQDNVQKKCKAVLSKLQGAMNRDGRQVSALLMELPKRSEFPDYYEMIDKPIDAKKIEEHLDRFEYATVLDFAGEVQLMLDNASRYNTNNPEVQADARRLHSLFFQRMGLMFPDVDFNAIKMNIGVPLRPSGSRSSRKQRQVFSEVGRLVGTEQQHSAVRDELGKPGRGKDKERRRARFKVVDGKCSITKIGSGFVHPADLVVYKRKRSVRRKSRSKAAAASASGAVTGNKRKRSHAAALGSESNGTSARRKEAGIKGIVESGGPLSWARARSLAAAAGIGGGEESYHGYKSGVGSGGGGGRVAEAALLLQPKKKSRTDSGRRRPSGGVR